MATSYPSSVTPPLGETASGSAAPIIRTIQLSDLHQALREGWEAKRKLAAGVSSDQIDLAVTRALESGASGAKLTVLGDRAPGLALAAPPDPLGRLPAALAAPKRRRRLRHARTLSTGSDIRCHPATHGAQGRMEASRTGVSPRSPPCA